MTVSVIGGGIAGIMAALSLADRGTSVTLIEEKETPGGHMAEIADCVSGFEPKLIEAEANPLIEIITGASVKKIDGSSGNFTITLSNDRTVNASSVILATGYEPFDPSIWSRYHLENPNVYTSLEFERIISLSSPEGGRLPDNIKRIGFIQCIGSREPEVNPLCSSVCCMYTANEVKTLLARNQEVEVYVFYMDLRVAGRDAKTIEKLKKEGVNYIRTRIPEVITDNGNIWVQYEDTKQGRLETLDLDAVVLAVGLLPSKSTQKLSELAGIELDEDGYIKLRDGVKTSVEGIYVAGCASTPLRISDSVAQAEAAATLAAEEGALAVEPAPEIDHTGDPVIGLVIFTDGLGEYLDLDRLKLEIADSVASPQEAASFQELGSTIESLVKAGSNRIIVAGLSHRKHEEMVRDMVERAGLNRYLVEIANIREQAAWVHPTDEATTKSIDLIRMAAAKLKKLSPLEVARLPVTQKALVIGGGVAGMRASLEIAAKGIGVYLVEREDTLGDSNEIVADLKNKVESDDLIEVMTSAEIDQIDGFVGNFSCIVGDSTLEVGAIIIATGASPFDPAGRYSHGSDSKVITQAEFDRKSDAATIAMIQCDSSMVASIETVSNALEVKKNNPETQVFVLCEDVRTYGIYEKLYLDARAMGVIFLRYEGDSPPVYENGIVSVFDTMICDEVEIKPDLVVLGGGMTVGDRMQVVNSLLGTDMPDKFYSEIKGESHLRLNPVDFEIDGTFIAGAIKLPRTVDEAIAEGIAAASRVCNLLKQDEITMLGAVAVVDDEICSGCGVCVEACPFGAIELIRSTVEERITYGWPILEVKEVAHVTELCRGCGTCASVCPSSSIRHQSFEDEGVLAQIEAVI